jgi:hypothetical protein
MFKHFMPMYQRAHAAALFKERNTVGWERGSTLPEFTRREYWR